MNDFSTIIITYHPDKKHISNFIKLTSNIQSKIIIINNTDNECLHLRDLDIDITDESKILIINNKINKGIAFAQNQGIFEAIKLECKYVFLFDQDTLVNEEFFIKMIDSYKNLKGAVHKIGCLGPLILSINDSENNKNTIEKKDFIIASGSLYETSTFLEVGIFNSDYFIDLVDVEWCYRANNIGYYCYVDSSIMIQHNIGENNYPILLGREIRIGSPTRQFYLVRNWIRSLGSDSFSVKEKFKIFINLFTKIPLFLLCKPRKKRITMVSKGIIEGFKILFK